MSRVVADLTDHVSLAFRLLDKAMAAPRSSPPGTYRPTPQEQAEMGRDLAQLEVEQDERLRQEGRDEVLRQLGRSGHPSREDTI